MRAFLMLLAGLIVGIAGAILFESSFPPEPGSAEHKLAEMDRELQRTRILLAAAEARAPREEPGTADKLRTGARGIIEDIKDGRDVNLNDLYRATKPVLRDLSPVFERLHRKNMRKDHEFMLADLTRKYRLSADQQNALREWQKLDLERESAEMRAFHEKEGTNIEDIIKARSKVPSKAGLDAFMEKTLTGDTLKNYRKDRLGERLENVQREADGKVSQLHSLVELDPVQQDQVFTLMARTSPDYDPSMQFEGLSGDTPAANAGESRQEAFFKILRPEQIGQYEAGRLARLQKAQEDFSDIGIQLPGNWDPLLDEW